MVLGFWDSGFRVMGVKQHSNTKDHNNDNTNLNSN